jgi:hypothetical protein
MTLSLSRFAIAGAVLIATCSHAEEPLSKPAQVQPRYDGRVRLEYDYRAEGSAKDSDFYGYWSGNARDMADGRLDFYTSGRQHNDLDNASDEEGTYQSLSDANGVSDSRVLQAYLDAHDRSESVSLRLGRQYIDVADYLKIDGGQVTLFENRSLGGRAYFGRPVSYYSSVSGDLAGGLSLVGRPWKGNRTRFTYAEYHDDSVDKSDRNYLVDLQQDITDALRTRAMASILNDDFRMASLDLSYFAPGGGADLHMGGSRWGEFDARTRVYSPLSLQLGDQQPYTYLYGKADYGIGPKWMLSPGVSSRLVDSGDQDFSNGSYKNYDLTLTFEPCKALSSSVSLQYWDLDSGDDFLGLSGEVSYRHSRIWELSVGAGYTEYTYNSYSDISYSINNGETVFSEDGTVTKESPYAFTYFLRTKWNVTRRLILRLQGDVEDDKAASDLAFRGRGSVEVRF